MCTCPCRNAPWRNIACNLQCVCMWKYTGQGILHYFFKELSSWSLAPAPPSSPGVSGGNGSGGLRHLVSDWAVPGSAITKPWSSHLWRKRSLILFRSPLQQSPNRRRHTSRVKAGWVPAAGALLEGHCTWCAVGSGHWKRRCSGSVLAGRGRNDCRPPTLHLLREEQVAGRAGTQGAFCSAASSFSAHGGLLLAHLHICTSHLSQAQQNNASPEGPCPDSKPQQPLQVGLLCEMSMFFSH